MGPDNVTAIINHVTELRAVLLPLEEKLLALKKLDYFKEPIEDGVYDGSGEAIANIMLAYRHLEDARMRLGKVIQAVDGGVSIYDKPKQ